MPVNDSNFLIWFAPGESPLKPPLPRPFVREAEVLSPVVWLLPGEGTAFYINTVNNTALPGPLYILHEHTGTQQHVPPQSLTVIDFPTGQHTYGSFTMPALGEGFCRLGMGAHLSQWLWVTTAEKAAQATASVRFDNNGHRLQNIRYAYLPPNWQQQFRIRISVESEDPEHNKEIFVESDTGKTRHLYSEPRWAVNFLTPEYDRWGHRAMASLIEHDTIYIDGKRYAYHSAYKANMNRGDALSEGQFSLVDDAYSTLHRT